MAETAKKGPNRKKSAPALAVVQKTSNAVGLYAAGGAHLTDIPTDAFPHEAVLSADRRWLYVSNNGVLWMTDAGAGGNTVSVIDLAGRVNAGAVDLGRFRRPHGVDMDARGRLGVTTESPGAMLLIDPAPRRILRTYEFPGECPHMLRFSPDGEWAWISSSLNAAVVALHLESGERRRIPTGINPQGGVFDPAGDYFYLTNFETNSILVLDARRQEPVGGIATGEGPARIALTPDGGTLVYNLLRGKAVGFADVARRRQIDRVPLAGPPMSMSLSADGALAYVGIQKLDQVVVISVSQRRVVQVIDTPPGAGPDPAIPLG